MSIPNLTPSSFTLDAKLTGLSFAEAIEKTTAALKTEGFGVLTEIDVKATMKKKLDKNERNYTILGACNPPIAHQALSFLPAIGALLPCNVVVAENDDASISISIIDPIAMFSMIESTEVAPLAEMVKEKLERVLDQLV